MVAPLAVAHVERTGGVGRDEFDLGLFASAEGKVGEGRPGDNDGADLLLDEGSAEAQVDEAGWGDFGWVDGGVSTKVAGDGVRDFERGLHGTASHSQGSVCWAKSPGTASLGRSRDPRWHGHIGQLARLMVAETAWFTSCSRWARISRASGIDLIVRRTAPIRGAVSAGSGGDECSEDFVARLFLSG